MRSTENKVIAKRLGSLPQTALIYFSNGFKTLAHLDDPSRSGGCRSRIASSGDGPWPRNDRDPFPESPLRENLGRVLLQADGLGQLLAERRPPSVQPRVPVSPPARVLRGRLGLQREEHLCSRSTTSLPWKTLHFVCWSLEIKLLQTNNEQFALFVFK